MPSVAMAFIEWGSPLPEDDGFAIIDVEDGIERARKVEFATHLQYELIG